MGNESEEELQEYRVIVGFDKATKVLTSERWQNQFGELHHPLGQQAIRTWDAESGELTSELYYRNGRLHRDGDEPAEIYYEPGFHEPIAIQQTWYQDGVQSRANGLPSRTRTDAGTEVVLLEVYTDVRGRIHRDGDLPAVIRRHALSGETLSCEHYSHGTRLDPESTPSNDMT